MHPCLSCGACCAALRVLFHEAHLIPAGVVPHDMVEPAPIREHVVLRGTATEPRRCQSLSGEVGRQVSCTRYEVRPPPCREFGASWEDGSQNILCDELRVRYGLKALVPADWARPAYEASGLDES